MSKSAHANTNEMGTEGQIKQYRHPPIVERVISAFTSIPEDVFVVRSDSWKSIAKEGFPHFDPMIEWNLNIEERDGVPMLAKGGPSMALKQWFWEHPEKKRRGLAHQSNRDRFGINLVRDGDQTFGFDKVFAVAKEWLPRWARHFGAEHFDGVAVDYVNLLNATTVPQFLEGNRLAIGEIFKVFTNIPVPSETMLPPYDCQVNLLVEKKLPCQGRIQVRGVPPEGVRIEIQMNSRKSGKQLTVEQCFPEIIALHEWMITYFEALFTEKAKMSFDPIP